MLIALVNVAWMQRSEIRVVPETAPRLIPHYATLHTGYEYGFWLGE